MKISILQRFSILAIVSLIAWCLIEYTLGFHNQQPEVGKITNLVNLPILLIFFMFLQFQIRKAQNGHLSFKEALRNGFKMTFLVAFGVAIFYVAYNQYINPEWEKLNLQLDKEGMIAQGVSEQSAEEYVKKIEANSTLVFSFIGYFFRFVLLGILMSVISGLMFKKK